METSASTTWASGFLLLRPQGYRIANPTQATIPTGRIRRYGERQGAHNSALNFAAVHTFASRLASRFTVRFIEEHQRITTTDQGGINLVGSGLSSTQTARDSITVSSTDQSIGALGALTGVNLVWHDRYIFDGVFRRDGSSLFGSNNRWADYGRGSIAWRIAQEAWWPLRALNELKVRASVGTAGGRPRFDAQYETYTLASGGALSPNTLGNVDLMPEVTREEEYGLDAELFKRVGVTLTYAHAVTSNQIQLAPASVSSGFLNQWRNAGTIDNRTLEASLNIPLVSKRDFSWTARLNYDRTRSVIASLGLPPYAICPGGVRGCAPGSQAMLLMRDGERLGTIYGDKFITRCSELPAEYQVQCGSGREWQQNDEGLIVWVGAGNKLTEGVTRNLWQAERQGCVDAASGARIVATGVAACRSAMGTVNAPNGVTNAWGNAILLRDSTGVARNVPIGNTLPDYRLSLAQTVSFGRVTAYALVDASIGADVYNEGRHFSLGEFQTREQDQGGKTVETAKPLAHFWRGGDPETALGSYGFYNLLRPNSAMVEDASYAKIREVSVGYHVGAIGGVGDWTVSVIGRNLHTFTRYSGFDPEIGRTGGQLSSGVINGIDAWQYPNVRALTLSVASRF